MTEYKGVITPPSKIRPGSPVEIVADRETVPGQPKFALFLSAQESFYKGKVAVMLLRYLNKEWMSACVHVNANTEMFKVLTGTTRSTLLGRARSTVVENLESYKNPQSFTIGTDPEMFVVDGKDALIPAWKFLPKKLGRYEEQPFLDGYQAEFMTVPGTCLDGLTSSTRNGLGNLLMAAQKHDPNAKLSLKTVFAISRDDLKAATDEQVALACNPSRNVYGASGKGIKDPRKVAFRFAGGHMHFGASTLGSKAAQIEGVKALDRAAIIFTCTFAGMEDPVRREYYGLAGEYRETSYGMEYRTLSNVWLCAPGIMQLVWDFSREVLRMGMSGLNYLWDISDEQTQEIVNSCDTKAATSFVEAHKELIQALLSKYYGGKHAASSKGWDVLRGGPAEVLKDPLNVMGNWDLDGFKRGASWNATKSPSRWSALASSRAKIG